MGINWRQERILADRYLEITLNDWGNTLLLLGQAPAIGALVILRWRDAPVAPSLYFILVIACVWFGCINACREIVKEAAIFRRERLVNLDVGPYVLSKLQILAMLGFVQCILLLAPVHHYIHLRGNLLLVFLTLYCASLAGTTLGLLLSSLAHNTDQAVGLAPLVTIPQILFSKFVLTDDYLKGMPAVLEKLTIVKWSWDALDELTGASPSYGNVALDLLVLVVMSLVFLLFTWLTLRWNDNKG